MKTNVPDSLRYTKDHEWVKLEGQNIRVGITYFAVDQLGDITLVELPKKGTVVEAGKAFGTVESVKTLSDLFAPLSGTIIEVNDELVNHPEWVNEATYEKGWMVIIAPSHLNTYESLLDAVAYKALLELSEH